MSLSKKKDPTAPAEEIKTDSASSDELETVSAAEVDEVMKKYDRESNTRIWTGAPQMVIRCIMALFSVYCIFSTLWSTASLEVRLMIFLGCVDLMGFLYYPMSKHHVKENYIPWVDWIIMIVGSACFFYYALNFDSIIAVLTSASKMTPTFIVIGIVGILSLVELCRRCVGVPILCVAGALVVYTFWSMLSKGMDIQLVLGRVIYTLFYTTGGVIGTPINVCAKFIVVFIVFGAFLERTGIAKFFIDLANKVGEELGMNVEFKPIDWNAKEMELKAKTIDCVWNGMSVTPERKENMALSDKYLNNKIVLMALADSDIDVTEASQLADLKIGTQVDSSALEVIKANEAYESFKDNVAEYDTYDTAIMDLKAGRVDVIAVDQVLGEYTNNNLGGEMKECTYDLGDDFYAIGFEKSNTELRDKVNGALKTLVDNGEAAKISEKWFGKDIVTLEPLED